jgi:aminopeptidase N
MKKAFFTHFILVVFVLQSWALTDTYPKNPNIDVLHYVFDITLSDDTDVIQVEERVEVRWAEAGMTELRLDLIHREGAMGMEVSAVDWGGDPLEYVHEEGVLRILFPKGSTANERGVVTVHYSGIPAKGLHIGPNKHGDRSFFSDNWPNRARHWLAVVDHPYDKATCEMRVKAPVHYQVVSNGLLVEESNLEGGMKLTHWKQSVPIASWLYVLGVAEFAVQYVDEFQGKSIQSWVFPQDREAGFYDYAVPTKRALEFYDSYVGPFSYEKLANIQSNSVSGGMEAASAIFYSANSVVGDRNERWRNVIIHEVAHQWFGNSVTEYDWDDVWLSEGFATYFTLLFIEHEYGRDEFVKGLEASQRRVDAFHADHPEYTIVHRNLSDMSQVTSSHTYQKGSWILHMLRGVVGTDIYWEGIRKYYGQYKDGSATTADFRRVMEEVSGLELGWFFAQWLYESGELVLEGGWEYDVESGVLSVELRQVGQVMEMPVEVGIVGADGEMRVERLWLKDSVQSWELEWDEEPVELVVDPNTWLLYRGVEKLIRR